MKNDKGIWKKGDLEIVEVVYMGKKYESIEALKKALAKGENNNEVRCGK